MQSKLAHFVMQKLMSNENFKLITHRVMEPHEFVLGITNMKNDMSYILYSDIDGENFIKFLLAEEWLNSEEISCIYSMLEFIVQENNYILSSTAQKLGIEEDLINKWMSVQSRDEMVTLMNEEHKKIIRKVFSEHLQNSIFSG